MPRDDSVIFASDKTKVHINIENSRWPVDGLVGIRGELQFSRPPQGPFMVTGSGVRADLEDVTGELEARVWGDFWSVLLGAARGAA